jgi:hypothetical protein
MASSTARPGSPASSVASNTIGNDKTTLQSWVPVTGFKADQLKAWVLSTVLPDLWVFLEWHRTLKELNMVNQSPSLIEVSDTIASEFGVISQDPDAFVHSDHISPRMVWAHSIHHIKAHLQTRESFINTVTTDVGRLVEAFDFLKFIVKNLGAGRSLRPEYATKAHSVRKAKVTGKRIERLIPDLISS